MGESRLTIQEAAKALGVSETAIRRRVKRGTLKHEREDNGRIYVYPTEGVDPAYTGYQTHARDALISSKDETISVLREQLEAERQAHAEARRIIAGFVERLPALQAPSFASDERESPQTTDERPKPPETPEAARRPWWRFWR